ncbi:ABC transporter substrate-binding protein [Plantactinospora soyae]|uniref:NitT/TauT family transport system substrate-binding protein n=1 Tax=Plantactinospora soyae TaxID=1544732 RepID=A0A927M875_9ACTN|nr:ABC transporter substrate-binding protein [Plantactinospora soyae]MBE1489787.1 NitT/TauT family transport system substrate-binding protein [Plantactinospora soyae]
MASSAPRNRGLLPLQQSRRAFLGAVALGVSVPLLAACGDDSDSGGDGSGGGSKDLTFLSVIPLPSISNAPELLADTGGHFTKHGLNVQFEATQGSPPAIQTVIAGSALLTKLGDIETITAISDKNAPLVNLGGVEKQGLLRFMSSKRKPLTKAEDFRGVTMGLPSTGGTSEKTLDLVLASAGIPRESVKRQVVGLAPGIFELVKSGRIDGYIVSLDTSLSVLAQEPDAVAFAPSSVVSAGSQAYATSKEQLARAGNQDQIRRFLQAIADSIRFMVDDEKNDFKETIRLIGTKHQVPSFKDPGVAVEALKLFVKSWTVDGVDKVVQTNPDTWRSTYDVMVKSGLVPAGKDPSQWLNADYAPKAS